MAATAAPRYAPEDPTLPKPWKGLVDGNTGYLYYWNPETNVTQYDKPTSSVQPSKPSSVPISSSVQVQQGQHHDSNKYGRSSNGVSKFDDGLRSHQSVRSATEHSHSVPNGAASAVAGGSTARVNGLSGNGSGLSADSYRRRHEITVSGNEVPPPFTSFEESGFPSDILREMRYLLLVELMSYAVLPSLWGAYLNFGAPFYGGPILLERASESHSSSWPGCCL